jgi:redox-sensitive bicupin YhaK (pirin superfamily)
MSVQSAEAVDTNVREVAFRTGGTVMGPITRLVTPSDVGEMIKPFVFLDAFDTNPNPPREIGFHPHSGIATVSLLFQGKFKYMETSGTEGVLDAGSVEWMRASKGVWHGGISYGEKNVQGYQMWIALPPELENAECEAFYCGAENIAAEGPARIILGQYGKTASIIPAPPGMNYLDVRLKASEQWTYNPPKDHNVGWLTFQKGRLHVPSVVEAGELVVFEESEEPIHIEAVEDTRFVLGSAVKHPYDLVTAKHSVHTNSAALESGQAEMQRIGETLRAAGRID